MIPNKEPAGRIQAKRRGKEMLEMIVKEIGQSPADDVQTRGRFRKRKLFPTAYSCEYIEVFHTYCNPPGLADVQSGT